MTCRTASRWRGAVVATALAIASLAGCTSSDDDVILFAGAGLRKAVDELAEAFEAKTGRRVRVDYGGSGIIVGRVKQGAEADLFMPGDVGYVDKLGERIIERKQVSWFVPTIIVAKGNPHKITGLKDLLNKDIKVALGDPKACRIGQVDELIFKKNNLDAKAIAANGPMLSNTVNQLGVWVKMGTADMAIVWGAIAENLGDAVDRIEIPAEQNVVSSVVVGLLDTSARKDAARQFMAFLVSPEGRTILQSKGYRTTAP